MATQRRPLCADLSRDNSEPLTATASRIDGWLLVEYRRLWGRMPLDGSSLSEAAKRHVRAQLAAAAPARLLFVKRPERRGSDGIRVYHGRTPERDARFFGHELSRYDDLLALDLAANTGAALEHPLFVVCTHGKRDRCCAVYGRPLFEALRDELDGDWVWQCTHVGGDRFAGNLVIFPEGLYFGRVGPNDVPAVVDAYLDGRIHLDRYRGRCAYPFPVQAAEHAIRRDLDLAGIDDVALAFAERADERWRVAFRSPDGALHERTVGVERGELTYLTCDAPVLRRPWRFRALAEPAS
jgi:hypothetical protein